MSRTKGVNSPDRIPEDFYETPDWLVWALLEHWRPHAFESYWQSYLECLEPNAGNGAIIAALAAALGVVPNWTAVELRSQALVPLQQLGKRLDEQFKRKPSETSIEIDCPENFLMWEPGAPPKDRKAIARFDLAMSNPAFRIAQPVIERSMLFAREVVMLLPMGFLGSQERLDFNQKHPANIIGPIQPRASFTEDGGTDAQEYGWFIWPGEGRYKVIDARKHRERWEGEQEIKRRRRPLKQLVIDELPLFRK